MLKDMIKSDINTILNLNDFGETHSVNGKDIVCIIDYNASNNSVKVDTFAEFGVNNTQITLFAKATELTKKVSVNEMLMLDNKNYIVESFADNMGVYEIGLSQNSN